MNICSCDISSRTDRCCRPYKFMLQSFTFVSKWRHCDCSMLLNHEALIQVGLALFEHGSCFLITSLELLFVCFVDLGSYFLFTALE